MNRVPPVFDARDTFYQYTKNVREALNRADEARAFGASSAELVDCLNDASEWLDALTRAVSDD